MNKNKVKNKNVKFDAKKYRKISDIFKPKPRHEPDFVDTGPDTDTAARTGDAKLSSAHSIRTEISDCDHQTLPDETTLSQPRLQNCQAENIVTIPPLSTLASKTRDQEMPGTMAEARLSLSL